MPNRAAIIANRILKSAYGGPVLLFNPDGSFAKMFAEGETVQARGGLAAAVDEIYGDRLPGTITLRSGPAPEPPGQGRLFDTGEDDERFKSVRERPKPHTTVLSVTRTSRGIGLTVVSSGRAQLTDELLESVIGELREKEVYPPYESGDGLAGSVEGAFGDGAEIPSEFYEERYDWDELIEPHNEYWVKEFKDDVRRAVEELLDSDDIAMRGGDFPGETIGEIVAKIAVEGSLSVMSPHELADKLAYDSEFKNYEERGYEGVDKIVGQIMEKIRETWKNRQMMRQDDEKFDAMRKALDAPVEMPPNSDAVLRMIGAFEGNGWDAKSFRELVEEMPPIARQERFWKAVAKGSPKLTVDRMQAYLDWENPKAVESLPKSFGGKAVNPPKYRMVAEQDYEGYTISNMDEHMLGVAALYVEDMNEPNRTPSDPATGLQPDREPIYYQIMDAMKKWHVGAHPLSDASKGVGWIRYDLVDDDGESVMFIQEIQSDFMWAIELAAAGITPHLGGGFPDSWFMCPDCGSETERMTVEDNSGQGGNYTEIWCPKCSKAVDDDAELATQRKLARYILKKFQGWDHYLLGNLITTARRNGVDRVVMNTSETIKLSPASAPKSLKKLMRYDDLAKDFGFRLKQDEMYGHDEEFHSRAAARMPYHRAHLLMTQSADQSQQ